MTDLGQILCEVKYKFCLFVVGGTCPYQVRLLSCEKQGSSDFQHRREKKMKADTLFGGGYKGFSGSVSNSFDAHPGAKLNRTGPA